MKIVLRTIGTVAILAIGYLIGRYDLLDRVIDLVKYISCKF